MNFTKNQIIDVKIENLSSEAHGVGHIEGFTFFIKGALPGEHIKAQVTKLYKSYGIGRLVEIITPSPERIVPGCGIYKRCGGCSLQHYSYDAQLGYKTQKVLDALRIIGKYPADDFENKIIVEPCVGMDIPYRYRNKAQLPVGVIGGNPYFGFYALRSHEVIAVEDCLLCHEENRDIIKLVLEYIKENGVAVYDEVKHTGIVRHLAIRVSACSGEMMVCLVINSKKLPFPERLIEKLSSLFNTQNGKRVTGIVVNVNTEKSNIILGAKSYCLWGKPFITDSIGGIKFRISINSFYQVNPIQTELLYEKTLEYAETGRNSTALDIYCGIGTISLFLARKFHRVYGIEIVKEAVEDAKANAELNGVGNVEFIRAKAEDAILDFLEKDIKPDVIVVDPPRKGCDDKLLTAVLELKPERVVYVSCNPATLARDLMKLSEAYKLEKLSVFDCFPQTPHVETVVLMSYVENKG